MYKEKIINIATEEITYRDYTEDELAEVEKSQAEAQAKAEATAIAEAKRQAAIAKLAALGLEEDDLKALGF